MTGVFETDDLIKIAKRENNTKRSYLYVNPLQGKHVPTSPSLAVALFSALAGKVEARYAQERVLLVGFAETATGIGSTIAYQARNVDYYLNTTREEIPGAEYLFFTESHSHATEQRLVVNGFDRVLKRVDRIVFAEDEVTTGNTIEKIMRLLREKYAENALRFGMISIINSMSDSRLQELEAGGVTCDYLHRIPVRYRAGEIENHTYLPLSSMPVKTTGLSFNSLRKGDYWNCRIVADAKEIRRRVETFSHSVIEELKNLDCAFHILVIGTEEFMFPGLLIGAEIEKRWPEKRVRFHATTRSPIEVSLDTDYPLHCRVPLESLYGQARKTFLYNLEKYDKVLIVTDANPVRKDGLVSLAGALEQLDNDDITLIQWGDFDDAKQLFQ